MRKKAIKTDQIQGSKKLKNHYFLKHCLWARSPAVWSTCLQWNSANLLIIVLHQKNPHTVTWKGKYTDEELKFSQEDFSFIGIHSLLNSGTLLIENWENSFQGKQVKITLGLKTRTSCIDVVILQASSSATHKRLNNRGMYKTSFLPLKYGLFTVLPSRI